MPIKSRNPLRANAIAQLVKGVDDTVQDQMGFIKDISNGLYTAQLTDGSIVRGIPPQNVLTNSNLGINTPVYVVPREGVPLIDAVQTTLPRLSEVEIIQQIGST